MPVDSLHPAYQAAHSKWCRMRHVLGGEDAIKNAGELYLPRLSEQGDIEYKAYKSRAQFLAVTSRALVGLEGFIFRKNPTVEMPANLAEFAKDSTLTGLSWYDFTKRTVHEVVGIGRCGTLVDWDERERRPFVVTYEAEEIHNWRIDRIGGQAVLGLLVLFECDNHYEDIAGVAPAETEVPMTSPTAGLPKVGAGVADKTEPPDEFEHQTFPQWRVYKLHRDGDGDPFVMCEVWRKRDPVTPESKPEWILLKQTVPTRRGVALTRIPFIFHGPKDSLPEICLPPLEDMAIVNVSLYRTSADLENGRHFCGVPTPYAIGFETTKPLKVGTTTAWVTETTGAEVGFLEFTGGGLQSLETAVAEKKAEMAALGARMLEPEAKKAEAFDTVAVRAAAETASLANITVAMTQSISRVLQVVAWWMGTTARPEDLVETVNIELNTEFVVTALPADQITALTTAYLGGALDFETYFWRMQQGEVFPPEATAEEVLARIQTSPPPGMAPPPPNPDPNAPPPAAGGK